MSWGSQRALRSSHDQRAQTRFSVALPAIAMANGSRCSVSIMNITNDGAMIKMAADLPVGAALALLRGTVSVAAKVIWQQPGGTSGIKFDPPISDSELNEQLSRSSAVEMRRARKVSCA